MMNTLFKLSAEDSNRQLFSESSYAPGGQLCEARSVVSPPGVRGKGPEQPSTPTPPTIKSTTAIKSKSTSTSTIKYKICIKCSSKQPITDYPKNSDSSDGYGSYCRKCKNELSKERNYKDAVARFKHLIVTRIRYLFPKEQIPSDIETNLEHYLGYQLSSLRQSVRESLHQQGLSMYKCFKDGWHLDHIRPIASFPTHKIGDDIFKECWSFNNLEMISAQDNLKKGAKYVHN